MSYDIYFVRRDPGQNFADALEATEESYDGDPGPLGSAELEQWERIATRAGQILDGIQEFGSANSRELADTATGIQLSMIADEVSITVPSERPEQDELTLRTKIYALARVVEDETGLEGYDQRLREAISDPRQRLAPGPPAPPVPPAPASSAAAAPEAAQPPPAKPATARPWWKFWQS